MVKFWNWVRNEGEERTLYLDGAIAEETWWGDEVTPEEFREELNEGTGDITVWINSPGGDVFAATQIYDMLMEYPGKVTVKITSLAASAATIPVMAGDRVYMSPTAMMMIHNPATIAIGDSEEMRRAKEMLDEVKESIINAYEKKTKLSRTRLAHLMDAESWMNAKKALELGFIDEILYPDDHPEDTAQPIIFSRAAVTNSLLNKLPAKPEPGGVPTDPYLERFNKLKH